VTFDGIETTEDVPPIGARTLGVVHRVLGASGALRVGRQKEAPACIGRVDPAFSSRCSPMSLALVEGFACALNCASAFARLRTCAWLRFRLGSARLSRWNPVGSIADQELALFQPRSPV